VRQIVRQFGEWQERVEQLSALLDGCGRTILLPAWQERPGGNIKADGSIVTATDLACQELLAAELAKIDPTIPLLGEEMEEAEQLHLIGSERCWCLDPLDGTSNFATSNPGFAISLALIERGAPQLALILDPARRELFAAVRGYGATLNGLPIHASSEVRLPASLGAIDFKRLAPELAMRLAVSRNYRSQRNIGSCALEWGWLAAGRLQFIVHGGEKLWDYAAGSLIAGEAGCAVGDFQGAPLPFDRLSSPIAAAANVRLQEQLLPLL